jgi:hypothetical protein
VIKWLGKEHDHLPGALRSRATTAIVSKMRAAGISIDEATILKMLRKADDELGDDKNR